MPGGGGGGGGGSGGGVRMGTVPLQALHAQNHVIILKPCILLKQPPTVTKATTVAQQVQALQPKLPSNNNNNSNIANNNTIIKPAAADSKPELLRCKRRPELSTKLGLPKAQPASVARRNARERNRVKQVNLGFDTLRDHVPNGRKNKKLSKVDTLRSAVEYIKYLMEVLEGKPVTSLPQQSVSFAVGELPDAFSPEEEEEQGLSDGEGESAMLTDSDNPGVDENRCFPSPPLAATTSPPTRDVEEDVKPQFFQDVENRDPVQATWVPSLGDEHLRQSTVGTAEEFGHFESKMSQVPDSMLQGLTELSRLDTDDLDQMVSGAPHSAVAPVSLPETTTGLNSPVLTPLQNSPLTCMSFPHPQNPIPNPFSSYPHLLGMHPGKISVPRHSLSDAETNSSMMSPASSVGASDLSSEALSSLGDGLWDTLMLLDDFCADSSAFTTVTPTSIAATGAGVASSTAATASTATTSTTTWSTPRPR